MTQDDTQRLKNLWTVNKYDVFGRLLYVYEMKTNVSYADLIANVSNTEVIERFVGSNGSAYGLEDTGYSCDLFREEITSILSVNYYDDYDFLDLLESNQKTKLSYIKKTGYSEQYENAKGMLTGTRTYLLPHSPEEYTDLPQYTTIACYYDEMGNMAQKRETNHIGGYECFNYNKTFSGKLLTELHLHINSNQEELPEKYIYTYDHAERLLTTLYVCFSGFYMLSQNSYDQLGRLKTKAVSGNKESIGK